MTDSDIEALATAIAREMFTNGDGRRVQVLVLEDEKKNNLGGWSEAAVRLRIAKVIRHHQETTR